MSAKPCRRWTERFRSFATFVAVTAISAVTVLGQLPIPVQGQPPQAPGREPCHVQALHGGTRTFPVAAISHDDFAGNGIFVVPIDDVVRIRTGERGAA